MNNMPDLGSNAGPSDKADRTEASTTPQSESNELLERHKLDAEVRKLENEVSLLNSQLGPIGTLARLAASFSLTGHRSELGSAGLDNQSVGSS